MNLEGLLITILAWLFDAWLSNEGKNWSRYKKKQKKEQSLFGIFFEIMLCY